MAYVNKNDKVRFHCFGACKGDWDIYDLIMLSKNFRFREAQKVWAAHLGIVDFTFYNLLHDQNKSVVVSTLGSYITPRGRGHSQRLRYRALHCRLRLGRAWQKRHRTDGGQNRRLGLLPWRSGGRSGSLRSTGTGGQGHRWIFPEAQVVKQGQSNEK